MAMLLDPPGCATPLTKGGLGGSVRYHAFDCKQSLTAIAVPLDLSSCATLPY